jgi:uncharacterized protein
MNPALPAALAALQTVEAYPHPVQTIELIETHMSWVLLTGEFAYKIKRPVHYAFADMRALAQREHYCREELRLNRRFSADLYLDVCAITTTLDGKVQINGGGTVIDYAVRMRQFSHEVELDSLLDAGQVQPGELERFGQSLAGIHEALPVATDPQPWGRAERVRGQVLDNLNECERALASADGARACAALRPVLEDRIASAMSWIGARREQGRVRECHGDLHCRNLVRWGRLRQSGI